MLTQTQIPFPFTPFDQTYIKLSFIQIVTLIKGDYSFTQNLVKVNCGFQIYNSASSKAFTPICVYIGVCPLECFISNEAFTKTFKF